MNNTDIAKLDWSGIARDLDREGYALLSQFLDAEKVDILSAYLQQVDAPGSVLALDVLNLGRGERRHWRDVVPAAFDDWPAALYELLAPIANRWNRTMGLDTIYPASDDGDRQVVLPPRRCASALSDHLGPGDFLALHQDVDADGCFPIQLTILLSQPAVDFTGGEFVMVEQRPRMQSRPMVLPLRKGDAALICATRRPFQGNQGYYRVNMKHAVSKVHAGTRISVEWLFHAPLGAASDK